MGVLSDQAVDCVRMIRYAANDVSRIRLSDKVDELAVSRIELAEAMKDILLLNTAA